VLEDVLWTSIYSDEEIRLIEEYEHLDEETLNSIIEIVELLVD
jgi:hypothetical protein